MARGLVAHVDHDVAVAQFRNRALVGVRQIGRIVGDDVATMPGFASVVAVNGGDTRRVMTTGAGAETEPDGDHEAAAAQADAVAGAGGEDFPVVVLSERLEGGGGDLEPFRKD